MKPQPGRMQPMLFNPFTFWTDVALKTGEIMLASAHAVERKAKSARTATTNGKARRSAKRRTRK